MKTTIYIFIFFLQSTQVFSATTEGRWHLGIGDPTFYGWLTVAIYFLAVARCVYLTKLARKLGNDDQFWLFLTVVLLFLGVNKQLDLQTWFTESMRDMAVLHGWYNFRRALQEVFIVFLGFAMVVTLFSLRIFLANSWRQHTLSWFGIILLFVFILTRAASFHHFDIFIGHSLLGVRVNVMLEIGSILLILLGTFYHKSEIRTRTQYHDSKDHSILEVGCEDSNVICPKCKLHAISPAVNERMFKCRGCGSKFVVRVVSS